MALSPFTRRINLSVAVLAAGTLMLSACGSSDETDAASTTTPTETQSATTGSEPVQSGPVTVTDQWVKAIPDIKESTMTGAFGKLTNNSDKAITIVSAKNSISEHTELHETVMVDGAMKMREVADGFTIEAGQTRELKPGSDHVMIMKMTKPLAVGQEMKITLQTKDNQTIEFPVVARAFTGANEEYVTHSK